MPGELVKTHEDYREGIAPIVIEELASEGVPMNIISRQLGHANIGVTWLHEGEPAKALHHFEIARRLDETSAQAAFGEAAARRRLGQLRKAEKAAERATELRPSYLPARLLLAEIRRERGDEEGAAEVLRPLAEDGQDPESLIQEMLSQWPTSAEGEDKQPGSPR